jgi:hypothetical protein
VEVGEAEGIEEEDGDGSSPSPYDEIARRIVVSMMEQEKTENE